MGDKEVKKEFKVEAQKNPDRFYPVKAVKALGFTRGKCTNCGNYFWSVDSGRKVCGDSQCVGGFLFIGKSPAKRELGYVETYKEFAKIHKKLGYTHIPRYPVVARWRTDTDFVQAGIYVFQPYVVSGEVEPPANPVVEPQFCLRFNDIDNVGITGSHYVGFSMMGEHAFMPPEKYDTNQYMSDHLTWLNKGLGLDFSEITIHEDAWAGGGNLGPSMEFFSRGLELSNQVYMQYEIMPNGNYKELRIKVLDMGQGQERVPWFTSGAATSYETTFPAVIKKLRKLTSVKLDTEMMSKFMKYAAWLNVDEVADIEAMWRKVAGELQVDVNELRRSVHQNAAMYGIAEHNRALLVALSDGALFSNVGGGYNLRVVFRRMVDLASRQGWQISIPELCELHARELKKFYPELSENLDNVRTILDVEKNKYDSTRQKTAGIVAKLVREKITTSGLLQLYDSQGISPELVREEAAKAGSVVNVPDNFYARVAELHEKGVQAHETKREEKLGLEGVPETKALYFGEWKAPAHFEARAVKVLGQHVVLDQTWFYPTSGGQLHDTGTLNDIKVVDVFKQGPWIVHKVEGLDGITEGGNVIGKINPERRKQLAQHHTSTHIMNAAARRVLGSHINQAGAKKAVDKASIDITHYASLSDKELLLIEKAANTIVMDAVPVRKSFIPRNEAEKRFGVNIYQGGVAPGKLLRIVEIPRVDVEACGGTHLDNTSEAGIIHVIGSSKIADDIVRIEFVAGNAAKMWEKTVKQQSRGIAHLVKNFSGITVEVSAHGMQLAAEVFSVSVEMLEDTLKKFIALVTENEMRLLGFNNAYVKHTFTSDSLIGFCTELFEHWKKQNKEIERLTKDVVHDRVRTLREKSVAELPLDAHALVEVAAKFKEILLLNKYGIFVFHGSEGKFKELMTGFGAKGGGKDIKQGKVENVQKVVDGFRFA